MSRLIFGLFAVLLFSNSAAFSQASIDWTKSVGECKGEFEERTKCMIAAIKALEGRANAAESRLAEVEKRLRLVEEKTLDARVSSLETNTIKRGQPVSVLADFRKQCMHWIDTSQPATFVPCNSGPDPRDEGFVLLPR
jgi:hypothetical protein